MIRKMLCVAMTAVSVFFAASPVEAQQKATPTHEAQAKELDEAIKSALEVAKDGPMTITLEGHADLYVPQGQTFIPSKQAGRMLRALGNSGSDDPTGIVIKTRLNDSWIVVIRYFAEGYIRDDDAKNWNADDMLQSIKDYSIQSNAEREKHGFPAIEVVGWLESPQYDAKTHRMISALASRERGAPAGSDAGVNYNTYALGRHGYFSLNLLTMQSQLTVNKAIAHDLLARLTYHEGKRYENFDALTDQVASYGLTALVGGMAAKKLGVFTFLLAFLTKFAKIIALAAMGLLAFVGHFFRRKSDQTT